MSRPSVRPLDPAEISLAAALHAACFPQEPWDAKAIAALAFGPGGRGLLALGGGAETPRGLAILRLAADEAEILTLGVVEAARRRGVGRALLASLLAAAAEGGARRLHLEVAEDNAPALALYRAAGFERVGRRPGYYRRPHGPAVAALLLARDLAPR